MYLTYFGDPKLKAEDFVVGEDLSGMLSANDVLELTKADQDQDGRCRREDAHPPFSTNSDYGAIFPQSSLVGFCGVFENILVLKLAQRR